MNSSKEVNVLEYKMIRYDYYEPCLPMKFENMDCSFIIDTGCNDSLIFKTGIEKLFGSLDNFLNRAGVSDIEFFKNNSVSITLPLEIENGSIYNIEFFVNIDFEDEIDRTGILGTNFVRELNFLTFDFKKNTFSIDGPRIKGTEEDFYFDSIDCMVTNLKVGKENHIAIIDTGFKSKEKVLLVPLEFNDTNKNCIKYCGKKIRNAEYVNAYDEGVSLPLSGDTKKVFSKSFVLTRSLFEECIIQFDIKNRKVIVK